MLIERVRLRGVLDSRAHPTVEADLQLAGQEGHGRGSCPVAIAPGRRERRRGLRTGALGAELDQGATARLVHSALHGRRVSGQREFDAVLRALDDEHALGADVTLALSLAFARAAALHGRLHLLDWLVGQNGSPPRQVPRLLVNAFSGGIHARGAAASFQQIMTIPLGESLAEDIRTALSVHSGLEEALGDARLSASSGFLVGGRSTSEQLALLAAVLERRGLRGGVGLGVDVAAEHLAVDGGYRFEGGVHDSAGFGALLLRLAGDHGLSYVEDPFDPADTDAWHTFTPRLGAIGARVVGDDLFASDARRVEAGPAHAVLLKPSQAGTVSATLDAASAAASAGLRTVVSHRSGETEDTSICDLAVAVGADHIKIGGPRRGDRIAKYNRFLRLLESPLLAGLPRPPVHPEENQHVPCQ
ncbi:hypothetical protein [Kitasatospora sp. NPDC094011]|uniref:hypothetical protein n=1 Tax=Kitasatospora sp. NPDC094011 TaxID=3364090 RepID=UPI0038166922